MGKVRDRILADTPGWGQGPWGHTEKGLGSHGVTLDWEWGSGRHHELGMRSQLEDCRLETGSRGNTLGWALGHGGLWDEVLWGHTALGLESCGGTLALEQYLCK